MSDDIKVVVKVRPLISREIEEKLPYQWRVDNNTLYQLDSNGKDLGQTFTFDKVYDEDTKTTDVYNDIAKPIVEAATAGINGTIFAYGQTSSGKTYTMTGTEESPGIIPLAVLNLFEIIKNIPNRDFLVRVSYIEIYNETVKDLLDLSRDNIKIHEDYGGNIKLDVSEQVTSSPQEVLDVMVKGNNNRQTGVTNMNEKSSRSHSIFQITIESREHIEGAEQAACVNVSQLNLVDLAGSERAGQTKATGIKFKEGTLINKSLSALALVIKQLSEGNNRHINYRDNKLTRILQNSLGGNAKTNIICAITPAAVEETISTLQFATRAKTVKNKPEVNAVSTDATMLKKLTKELSLLQAQLESKKNLEVMLETKKNVEQDLQKRIEKLQKVILNGFNQRSNVEMMGGVRRPREPPRRATISTLHSIEESPVAANPKYCTPLLKYNPLSFQNLPEFAPIQNQSKLASFPEEPLATTPPPNKNVNFGDEVIELDSDDDDSSTTQCSPYHIKCRDTKTPPCVLRKIAKTAEKNLEDIVELTGREKIYTPDVVELMEKLEQSNTTTSKLQDEVELLKLNGDKKNKEIELLKQQIKKAEEEVSAVMSIKEKLSTQCEEYQSKLTDSEVSLETLKRKAKLREEELLSLLNEQKQRNFEDINIKPIQPKDKDIIYLNEMSKDISVNNDIENSISSKEDPQAPGLTDLQAQLTAKDKAITELEVSIIALKQKVDTLEQSNQLLQHTLADNKVNIEQLETENSSLKSNIELLNSTIKNQQENLQIASNDIQSYNSLIQELQIKLTNKDKILNIDINDPVIEKMIANEEKSIAINDNIKNIIYSLKLALLERNKIIEDLKLSTQKSDVSKDKILLDLSVKNNEIDDLKCELTKIKSQLDETKNKMNILENEKNDYTRIEHENIKKISELERHNSSLNKINEELNFHISNLTKTCEDNNETITNYLRSNEELTKKLNETSNKVVELEECINKKDKIISDLCKNNDETDKYIDQAKLTIEKIQKVFVILTGNTKEVPKVLDSFVSILNTLTDSISTLEEVCVTTIAEKSDAINIIKKLQQDIDNLNQILQELSNENKNLINSNLQLEDKIKNVGDIIANKEHELNAVIKTINELENSLKSAETMQVQLIDNIVHKLTILMESLNINNDFLKDDLSKRLQSDELIIIFDKLVNHILQHNFIVENKKTIDAVLEEDAQETYKQKHMESCNKILSLQNENRLLVNKLEIIQSDSDVLKDDLNATKLLLQELHVELQAKSSEIVTMEHKAREWKYQFEILDKLMKQQALDLQNENEKIKARLVGNEHETALEIKRVIDQTEDSDKEDTLIKCKENSKLDINSPPSLLTICCNKIIDDLDMKDCSSASTSPRTTNQTEKSCKHCEKLVFELQLYEKKNIELTDLIEKLNAANKELLEEQDNIRKEIELLVEPAEQLQKKILNHKTNLNILTATTYAENKSLRSQVKCLQHHHSRFHNVCQRDIPEFKKQLINLMSILKDDPTSDSVKRFSLPNVLNTDTAQLTNESSLDGEMLMLDTNVTLTTADNTVTGYDQTCLDLTQTLLYTETSSQTNFNEVESNLYNKLAVLKMDNETMYEKLEVLEQENSKLKKKVDKSSCISNLIDAVVCHKCEELEKIIGDLEILTRELSNVRTEKENLEYKYQKLVSQMKDTDLMTKEILKLQCVLENKTKEINILENKTKEMKSLQEENNSLSSELMENLTEIDNLTSELDKLKKQNLELKEKCDSLKSDTISGICIRCNMQDEATKLNLVAQPKLNRSLSDSDSSSRSNKITTLQNELDLGREDCKKLTQDVASIKQHLDSTMCMDLDVSMDTNVCYERNIPGLAEIYKLDRKECQKYYSEVTGKTITEPSGMKIIDVMKHFYNDILSKHGNEVENLINKLNLEKSQFQNDLKIQIHTLNDTILNLKTEIQHLSNCSKDLNTIKSAFAQMKTNLELVDSGLETIGLSEKDIIKDNFLSVLDDKLSLTSVQIFETLVEKYKQHCNRLQNKVDNLSVEVTTANESLAALKIQHSVTENELNLLQKQRDKIQEISKAVTLDLIKKEKESKENIKKCCNQLLQLNLIDDNFQFTETVADNISTLVNAVISKYKIQNDQNEKESLIQELKHTKMCLDDKEKQIKELQELNNLLRDANNNISIKTNEWETKYNALEKSQEESKATYTSKLKENTDKIESLIDEIKQLKESITTKESVIESLGGKVTKTEELLDTISSLQKENKHLESVNKMILEEKDLCLANLEKSCETIRLNNIDMEKMTSDILVLRESIRGASETIKTLKEEAETLSKENVELKENLEVKTSEYHRLKENIKTHERTAEIQTRIINRMKKSSEDDAQLLKERENKLNELSTVNGSLQSECERLKNNIKTLQDEVDRLKILELRLSELDDGRKSRTSLEAIVDSSKRRRQSLHDSKRLFDELEEHKTVESAKPDEFFMDIDDDGSGRSTPFPLQKGRDSLLSRTDQSDKDEDHPSRPSSVLAIRRKRQSSHDLHRSVIRNTPSPHDLSNKVISELDDWNAETAATNASEVSKLKQELASCRQELAELKEMYRELDEECETCAEYLHERDKQCAKLKKEKAALEDKVNELQAKLSHCKCNVTEKTVQKDFANVAVNTDEDWTNLHAVVVDRMSYNMEVEKNKKLTKTIEELRFKKQMLKDNLSKVQKSMETKYNKEIEATRSELKACKEELKELKKKYDDLDDECETCAKYLKEKDEQCRKLIETKNSLEKKIQELHEDSQAEAHCLSVRKKRQTIHDLNRQSAAPARADASTEASDDLLSYQVERDSSSRRTADETQSHDYKRLQTMVDTLSNQKVALEMQLRSIAGVNAMAVATGSAIVQSQQITDVMRENRKLKKINSKLLNMCQKRGKNDKDRENEDPCEQG